MLVRSLTFISHNVFSVTLGILGLTFLIAIHELGHYLFCKMFGIHTPTFSIGFGPQLIRKKMGDTNFVISAIPLGGYVEIAGLAEVAQGEQKQADRTDSSSFTAKPYWQKLLVMVGGIGFNVIFTYLAFIALFFVGFPKSPMLYPINANTTIQTVQPESPAATANLKAGDIIISINGKKVQGSASQLREEILKFADQTIELSIQRDGQILQVPVTLSGVPTPSGKRTGILGVAFETIELKASNLTEAIKKGVGLTHTLIANIAGAFVTIFKQRDVSSMGGPLSIISATVQGAGQSLWLFLLILAIISVNLAVLNVIPLPILDGGQILYFTIEAIVGRPLPLKVREYIHVASWLFVLGLIIYLSANDLYRIIKPWFGNN